MKRLEFSRGIWAAKRPGLAALAQLGGTALKMRNTITKKHEEGKQRKQGKVLQHDAFDDRVRALNPGGGRRVCRFAFQVGFSWA